MKCVRTILFDVRGYFEISLFEILRIDCITMQSDYTDQPECTSAFDWLFAFVLKLLFLFLRIMKL